MLLLGVNKLIANIDRGQFVSSHSARQDLFFARLRVEIPCVILFDDRDWIRPVLSTYIENHHIITPSRSLATRCICLYFATKWSRLFLSSAGSPEETRSFPAGPRISSKARLSVCCAAANRAAPASSGE